MSNFLLKFGDRSELYRIVRAKKDLESLYEIQSLEVPSRVGEVFFDRKQVDVRDANTGAILRTYTGNWKLVKQVEEADPEIWQKLKFIDPVKSIDNRQFLLETREIRDIRGEIFNFAVSQGLTILSLSLKKLSLEEVFRDLTRQ